MLTEQRMPQQRFEHTPVYRQNWQARELRICDLIYATNWHGKTTTNTPDTRTKAVSMRDIYLPIRDDEYERNDGMVKIYCQLFYKSIKWTIKMYRNRS